ncbi:hypothetical protein FOZ61_000977 [Perkinsus olseni]|uniref:Uncharacterized protein n=1 Tax=Perkinsus olseni TaxID=32597 RepID=A0A7J6KTF9_PEROL|nr:hypothetical protein FOZ61_000977 [Perkinsus olseni]
MVSLAYPRRADPYSSSGRSGRLPEATVKKIRDEIIRSREQESRQKGLKWFGNKAAEGPTNPPSSAAKSATASQQPTTAPSGTACEASSSSGGRTNPENEAPSSSYRDFRCTPKTLSDLERLLGKELREGDNSVPGLYQCCLPPLESITTCPTENVLPRLRGSSLYVWHPFGGSCPSCKSIAISSVEESLPVKHVVGLNGWPARLVSTRRSCRNPECKSCFSALDYRFIDSLPSSVRQSLESCMIVGKQIAVSMTVIRRLRNGSHIGRELENLAGEEQEALQRRRALFCVVRDKCRPGSLLHQLSKEARSIWDMTPTEAVPSPSVHVSHSMPRTAVIRDLSRHRSVLCRELASYTVVQSISLDFTRSTAKRLTSNKQGYVAVVIGDAGVILNTVAVPDVSLAGLLPALRELRGHVPDHLVIFTDYLCCNEESSRAHGQLIEALQVTSLELKVDPLHGIFRLLRATDPNHVRHTMFAVQLSRAFYQDSAEDMAQLRAKRAAAGLVGAPSKTEIRQNELDEEGRSAADASQADPSSGAPFMGTVGAPLFRASSNFWGQYQSLQKHIRNSCSSDSTIIAPVMADSHGNLCHTRGTSRNESRHACLRRDLSHVSRAGGPVYDCKILWRAVFANRRLFSRLDPDSQLSKIPIPLSASEYQATQLQLSQCDGMDITLNSMGVTFGHEYLTMLNSQRYEEIVQEWLEERGEIPDGYESGDEEPRDETEELVFDAAAGSAGGEGVDFEDVEMTDPEDLPSVEGTEAAFRSAMQAGKPKRKFCRLKGLHTTTHTVKLGKWSEFVRGTVRAIISEAPSGSGCATFVYRTYLRKTLDEVDDALLTGRKPLPYHPVSLDCIKTFLKQLNSCRATFVPPTVRGAEAIAELDASLTPGAAPQFDEVPQARVRSEGLPLGPGPRPVTGDDLCSELRKRSEAAKDIVPSTSSVRPEPAIPPVKAVKGICKFCSKPLTVDRSFNDHESDGSKFGRCPMDPRPPVDPSLVEMKKKAEDAARHVKVEDSTTGKRRCGLCQLPFKSRIIGKSGVLHPHETFCDENFHQLLLSVGGKSH